jgi:hypothetical protein
VGHLIGNRASFLCTEAPMLRIPETNFLHGISSHQLGRDIQAIFLHGSRQQHRFYRVPSSRVHFLDKGRSYLGDLFICAKDLFVEATSAAA